MHSKKGRRSNTATPIPLLSPKDEKPMITEILEGFFLNQYDNKTSGC